MSYFKVLFILLPLFSYGSQLANTHEEIIAQTKVFAKNNQLKASDIFFVYDLDNTLMASTSSLGSDQWFAWQSDMLKSPEMTKFQLFDNFDSLLRMQGDLFALGSMRLTEPMIPEMINTLTSQGSRVMALTSRGPAFRNSTERELARLKVIMNNCSIKGRPSNFIPAGGKRQATLQNCIFMTSGMNKGVMLKYLVSKMCKKPKLIVFVDDHPKHIKTVNTEFANHQIKVHAYLYNKELSRVEDFKASDKSEIDIAARKLLKIQAEILELN